MTGKNKFVIIAPMYNASATLPQMLHSLFGQSYENWHLILIDDVSDQYHVNESKRILENFDRLGNGSIVSIWNSEKRWEVANILEGLKLCDDNDIVCRLDPDDFLCDLDALRIIDQVYNETETDCLWTAQRWHDDRTISPQNISGPLPSGVNPYTHPWVSSHFKTFRKRLLNTVKDENFRDQNGEYFKRIGDQVFMLPALYHSKKSVYLPMVMYSYRCDMSPATFQTEDAKFQRDEALFLRARGYVK